MAYCLAGSLTLVRTVLPSLAWRSDAETLVDGLYQRGQLGLATDAGEFHEQLRPSRRLSCACKGAGKWSARRRQCDGQRGREVQAIRCEVSTPHECAAVAEFFVSVEAS